MKEQKISTVQSERINSPEEFMGKLYDAAVSWLLKSGGKVIQDFGPQKVEEWEKQYDFHKGTDILSLGLTKACVVVDSKKVFLLTLGEGRKNNHDMNRLRLQFGFLPSTSENISFYSKSGIKEVKGIIYQGKVGSWGSGEIFSTKNGIDVDCWTDDPLYGGKHIGTWSPEKIMTKKGLEESLNLIKETVRRAFNKDLT